MTMTVVKHIVVMNLKLLAHSLFVRLSLAYWSVIIGVIEVSITYKSDVRGRRPTR